MDLPLIHPDPRDSSRTPPDVDLPPQLVAQIDAIVVVSGELRAVTTDERYHDLRQEVDKLNALAGGSVDWRRVVALGEILTREVGKDLGVIAYMTLARQQLRVVGGLLAGVHALGRLLQAPPTLLTPNKPRGRASAIEWLLTRLHGVLQAPDVLDPATIVPLDAAIRELRSACREALGDLSPSFGPIIQMLQALRDQAGPITSITDPAAPPVSQGVVVIADQAASAVSKGAEDRKDVSAAEAIVGAPATRTTEPARVAEASAGELALQRAIEGATPWLAPIDPEDPCGIDPAGHEGFIDAQEELAKLTSASSGPVDWARVEIGSSLVLQRLSKDLRAAVWFTLARAHRGGLAGLCLGFAVVIGLFEGFGDDIYPRRVRSRRDQSDWLIKQSSAALLGAATTLTLENLATLRALNERLATTLRTRLGDEAPSLRPLRDAIAQAAELLAARTPPPATPTASTTPDGGATQPSASPLAAASSSPTPGSASATVPTIVASPASTVVSPPAAPGPSTEVHSTIPVATVTGPPANTADLENFLLATGEALQQTAQALREAAPADPRAYRLLRTGLWIHLVAAPTLRPDGNTALPGLEERDRALLTDLNATSRWAGLLARSENLLPSRRLALDLQRHSAAALSGLGPDYIAAGETLRIELRALLARLPGLAALHDRDGRPLADPETQRWLAAEVSPRPAASTYTTSDDPQFWTDLHPRLNAASRNDALAEAQRHIDASHSEQLRFTRRLSLAELCADIDPPLATILFAALADDLERRALDSWDLALSTRILVSLARGHHRDRDVHACRRALHRLARLDAAAAAALLVELPEARP
jgi:type VI secretion system protein VasJ